MTARKGGRDPRFAEYDPRPSAQAPLPVEVREARRADVEAISRLSQQRRGVPLSRIRKKIAREIEESQPDHVLLVAVLDRKVVAFARARRYVPAEDAPANTVPEGYYLLGVVVAPEARRRGVARALTRARLDWIAERADVAFYFAHSENRASHAAHDEFGFVEVSRDFSYPRVTFEGGEGVLFRVRLRVGAAEAPAE